MVKNMYELRSQIDSNIHKIGFVLASGWNAPDRDSPLVQRNFRFF